MMSNLPATRRNVLRINARAARCATCPPTNVCAWSCIQGANLEEMVIGLVLESEHKFDQPASQGMPNDSFGDSPVIWDYVG